MHFPAKLTEEEEILQRKFAKLRKKVSFALRTKFTVSDNIVILSGGYYLCSQ